MEQKNELQRNAIAEARRIELESFQRALDVKWLNSRMEDGRMGRCLALIAREAALEKEIKERTDHAAFVNERAEQETKLARAIEEVRRAEQNELLRRHHIRTNNACLQDLQKKLQAGYNRRDLEQQILHNEYRKLQEKAETFKANEVLSKALLDEKRAKEIEEREKLERSTKYCAELQQQLVNKQRQKQCQYEDTLIEKKMLDDVIRTIADEDQRELQQKFELREKCRREMVTFKMAREAWKQKQKHVNMQEEQQIEEQQKMVSDRYAAIEEERKRKLRQREEINEKICAKILADEAERQERENIIKSLQEQEYLEKNHQDDLAEKAKMHRIRRETADQLAAQMSMLKQRQEEERKKDEAYRKHAEDELKKSLESEKGEVGLKRTKQQQYIRELRQQMADNEERRKREKMDEAARANLVWDYHSKREEAIQKERSKLMQEHAPHLLGYLQAGVLQHQDIPHIKEGASKHPQLSSLDIDSIAVRTHAATKYPKCNAQCTRIRKY